MKIVVLTICLLAIALSFQFACSSTNLAVDKPVATANTNSVVANSEVAASKNLDAQTQRGNLKKQALETSQTVQTRDFAKLADYTHSKVLDEQAGGREKLISESRRAIEQLENEGFKIVLIEVGEPGEIVTVENQLFAVVPVMATLDTPQTKMRQGTSIVGISEDNGANWKFINGINQTKFKELFPSAADKIKIPQDSLESVKDK